MWYNSLWLQTKDDYCAGCQNITHCQQQSYSGLHSPRWSCCIYFNVVRCTYAFNQCDHNPLGKLVLYQTCQVRWSCLGTPSFDKGYFRPSIDPVAKFLWRPTTIINFGKRNEIYKQATSNIWSAARFSFHITTGVPNWLYRIGQSLFTFLALLTYAYYYLMKLIT